MSLRANDVFGVSYRVQAIGVLSLLAIPVVLGAVARALALRRRVAWLAASMCLLTCACLPAAAFASVRMTDRAATRAYLRATYADERVLYTELARIVASIEARADGIASECPGTLTYAPRDAAFEELGEEAQMSAFYAGLAPVRASTLRFAHALRRLRWSDHGVTRLLRAEATEEQAKATLALPDPCADIAAWKAGAYATLPQSAASFLARVHAIESASSRAQSQAREAEFRHLLGPHEAPSQRRLANRIERLEQRVDARIAAAQSAADKKLAAALGVPVL